MKNGFAVKSDARLNYQPCSSHFIKGNLGQCSFRNLEWMKLSPFMLLLPLPRLVLCLGFVLLFSFSNLFAQTNYYSGDGSEYTVVGSLAGDQMYPDVALNSSGGFIVWQDNATDGSGWGISARRLDATLSGTLSTFRVNIIGTNDQENPRVTMLKNRGAAFVWQGGKAGLNQHIYARFMTSSNTWLSTTDILVNTFTNNFQITPAIATLNNSNVVIVWASFNQVNSNSLLDVYGQIYSQTGAKVGTNFLINQFTTYNQRTPAVAPLKNGGFVVAWVSESQRSTLSSFDQTNGAQSTTITLPSVDIYARLFANNGAASAGEFLVSADSLVHANPALAVGSYGNFIISWSGKDLVNLQNSWDVFARPFSTTGLGGKTVEVNTRTYGDEFIPKISAIGTDYLVAWTSLGQDGDREGVFGQFIHGDGSLIGNEFRMNSTTTGQQMEPAIASDGSGQFLAIWTGFTFSASSFDLFAQRYANVNAILQPLSAPFVSAPFVTSNNVYQPQLQVTWAPLQGIAVSNYEVYVDGSGAASGIVAGNLWTMTAANSLVASSTHSFAVDYVTTDGRRSPLSPSAGGTTWNGLSWGGIPYEWMQQYFGGDVSQWPAPNADGDGDGMSNLDEFRAGTIPTNAASVLMVQLTKTAQGMFVSWNTQPGATYQLQVTTNLTTWSNVGSPRFAAGTTDSVNVGSGNNSFYHVVLVR